MAKGKKTDATIELRLKPINLHYVTQIFCIFLSLGINPPYIFTLFRRKKNQIIHKRNESKRYIIYTYLNTADQFNAFFISR